MNSTKLPSQIISGAPYTWLLLVEVVLINALIYAQFRASGFDEASSFGVAIVFLLLGILVPHYFAPHPSQCKKRLSLVHNFVLPILILIWLIALTASFRADKNFAATFLQLLTIGFIAPVFYIFLISLNVLLITKASSTVVRIRSAFGALGGALVGVIGILLLVQLSPIPPTLDFRVAFLVVPIFGVLGFFAVLIIDILLRKGVVSFVNFATAAISVLSMYFLIWSSTIFAVFTTGFLVGNFLYFMMKPAMVAKLIGLEEDEP